MDSSVEKPCPPAGSNDTPRRSPAIGQTRAKETTEDRPRIDGRGGALSRQGIHARIALGESEGVCQVRSNQLHPKSLAGVYDNTGIEGGECGKLRRVGAVNESPALVICRHVELHRKS